MDQTNIPIIAKRIWGMVRVMFFMLRKGISKRKLLVDFNMMLKRGKIAGKAISNLLQHHDKSGGSTSRHRQNYHSYFSFSGPREYEFSCSNTPNYAFIPGKRHRQHHHKHFFNCTHAPATQEDDAVTANAVKAVLEILNNDVMVEASPALPGFGRSPMVRQLRITDSPFPVRDTDEDNHVDEAAEKFIERFYKELRKQK